VFKITKSGYDYMQSLKITKCEALVVEAAVSFPYNSTKDIQRRLSLSQQGVKFHLTKIYKKMRVSGKSGLVLQMTPHLVRVWDEIK
jgi:ATP/maltotriose-dependent transcriptional regulator MalT